MINRIVIIFILGLFFSSNIHSQCPAGGAVFVNEVYNDDGDKEYVELVVVGDPAAPTDPVDLEGWIFDDNNIAESNQGNKAGHLILSSDFSSINPGAIILIYSNLYPYTPLPANDPPWLYVVSGSEIDGCSQSPNTSSSSYSPCGTSGGNWTYVLLRDPGDVTQIRNPSAEAYHGVKWGGVNVTDSEIIDVNNKTISLTCGSWTESDNYSNLPNTPGEANSPENLYLINSIRNGTIDCNNISLSCIPPCAEINDIEVLSSTPCDYEDFIVTATGLANMAQSANGETDFGINFVYFSGSTPPADAYIGGTSLEIVSYGDLTGTNPDQQAVISVSSGTMSPGTYNICAILDPESTDDECDPQQCEVIEIFQSPIASLDGESIFCPGDCHEINTTITGGTEPYEAFFSLSIGSFNIPFNIPAYDTNNELTICYSGTLIPYYDNANNTFYVPTSMIGVPFTGSGTITMTGLVDDHNCAAQIIDPNFMTLIFKEDLDISPGGPLEECDYNFDGMATFDLTVLNVILENGQSGLTTNWFEDADCSTLISSPNSFTTVSTTVYAFLSDNSDDKCDSDTIPIELIVIDIPSTGEDSQIEICNTETCVDFYNSMVGGAEDGGTWNDNDDSGVDLTDAHCVNFSELDQGIYNFTYTTQDIEGKCDEVSATLTIDISDSGNPGDDNYDTFCGAPQDNINLEGYLGDFDIGGTWKSDDGINVSDPKEVDMSSETIGVYFFYYQLENYPCELVEAVITIEIIDGPNAGNNNEITICNSGQNTIIDLNAALGIHDSNGDWTDNDNSGVNLSDPEYVDFGGIESNTFGFTYLIPENGACLEDSAVITVIVETAPFAGIDGANSICIGSLDTIDLFDYIGQNADSTGIWTQIGGDSVNITRPDTMLFTFEPVGIDSFLYITSGSCGNDSAYVYISISTSPQAGDDYIYTICQNEIVNLFDSLIGYNIGGIWLNSNLDTIFQPNIVNLNEFKTYDFSYIIAENGTCSGDTAFATIITVQAPEAGIGEDFTICQNSSNTFNFFDYLTGNSQSDGVWIDKYKTTISDPFNYSFETLPDGEYLFKYILDSNGYCVGDTAVLKITIEPAPDAGLNNSTTVCNGDVGNIVNLDSLIGSHGYSGYWINVDNSLIDISDSTAVNFKGIDEGTYIFKYKIDANSTCPADSSNVTVVVNNKLNAGEDKEITFCEGATGSIKVIDELNPDATTFYLIEDLNNTGALDNGSAEIDLSKLSLGTFNFSLITGINDFCGTDTSFLKIIIVEAFKAGENNDIVVCNDVTEVDLDILLGIHDIGGIWIDMDNSSVDVQSSSGTKVSFDGLNKGTYRYQYKIEASGSCPESSAIISVTVNPITYFDFEQYVCPDQNVTIGNGVYNLDNPTGTEILVNIYDCDSIVTINLLPKEISSTYSNTNESCFGMGKFVVESMNNAIFPITLKIHGVGDYSINELPFIVSDLPGGNYTFDIIDSEGCESNVNDNFTINSFTPFSININVTTNEDSYSLYVNTDINPFNISWSPANGLSCDNCLNPIAKTNIDQEYIVIITDEEGCTVSDTILLAGIVIEEEIEINIPNVFSPDDDGYNDIFYAKSTNVNLKYSMYIYDRWGEKVFSSENINFNESQGAWDGWYNGKKLNPGVFVYMIIIDLENGEKEIRTGDITLLK